MTKRFIDTSTLPKAWRKLAPSLKLTFYYLWNNCDSAGIWEVDEDLFEFENNGETLELDKLKAALPNNIDFQGELVLLKDFVPVNFSEDFSKLKPEYNPHKPLFRAINKNNLKLDLSLNQVCFKLEKEEIKLDNKNFKLIDVDEDKDEDKDEDVKKENPKIEIQKVEEKQINFPFNSEVFRAQWQLWKAYKKKKYKFSFMSSDSENRKLTELKNLSGNDEKVAVKIIEQSIDNGWKGFFELKIIQSNKKSKDQNFVSNR